MQRKRTLILSLCFVMQLSLHYCPGLSSIQSHISSRSLFRRIIQAAPRSTPPSRIQEAIECRQIEPRRKATVHLAETRVVRLGSGAPDGTIMLGLEHQERRQSGRPPYPRALDAPRDEKSGAGFLAPGSKACPRRFLFSYFWIYQNINAIAS